MSGATAAGLLQCSVGCIALHTPWTALAIDDERGSSSRHQSAIISSRSCANYAGWKFHGGQIQAGRSGLQMSSWPGTVIPRWRTSPSSRIGVSKASAFRFVSWTVCSPYPTLNLRRPSFSSRRCTDLEQSSVAYHICSVTSCLLLSLEDILLRTLLPVITVIVPAKWQSFMDTLIALTYLLTSAVLYFRKTSSSKKESGNLNDIKIIRLLIKMWQSHINDIEIKNKCKVHCT